MKRLRLDDGTTLAQRPDGAWTWLPEERVVNVIYDGDAVTLTPDDDHQTILLAARVIDEGPGRPAARRKASRPPPVPKAPPQPAGGDCRGDAILRSFIDTHMGDLSRAAVCVWLCLYRERHEDGIAKAGVEKLADRARCDRSTVIRSIKRLIEVGRLELVRRGGIGRGPSSYRVK